MADVKWIKITTDIFDDEKILLIESLPDAYAIITVWFKLLCLAGKMNNSGVFTMSNKIAYTDTMLATIFRMKESTVQLALNTFEQFGMIEIVNGVITIPNWEKHQSLDAYEQKKERDRLYQAERREKQKMLAIKSSDTSSDSKTIKSSDIEKNRSLEEDKEKEEEKKKNKNNIPAAAVYFPNDEKLNQAFIDYIAMRKQIKAPMTDRAVELAIKKLEQLSGGDNDVAIEIINQSIMNSWKGLFELKQDKPKTKGGIEWDKV